MSKLELIREIQAELERLNMKIDRKIIRGAPYRKESRRHKFLTARLQDLSRITITKSQSWQGNWIARAASAMSMFVL